MKVEVLQKYENKIKNFYKCWFSNCGFCINGYFLNEKLKTINEELEKISDVSVHISPEGDESLCIVFENKKHEVVYKSYLIENGKHCF